MNNEKGWGRAGGPDMVKVKKVQYMVEQTKA